jgi:thiamine biosynthesis protein ThiC
MTVNRKTGIVSRGGSIHAKVSAYIAQKMTWCQRD